MAALAINLLWFLIGAIVLAGVIYLVLYGINNFITQIPSKVEQGIWFIYLLLLIIYLIMALTGTGGGGMNLLHPFSAR